LFTGATAASASFTNIQNVTGGLGNDIFLFTPTAAIATTGKLTGTVNGGGSPTHPHTLIGPAVAAEVDWNITTLGGGFTTFAAAFVDIQNLVGNSTNAAAGATADKFIFANGGALAGTITGNPAVAVNNVLVGDDNGDSF